MGKVIGRINKKTGAITIKTEGFNGEACLEATRKLRARLGIDKEPERTNEYYIQPQTEDQSLQQGQ